MENNAYPNFQPNPMPQPAPMPTPQPMPTSQPMPTPQSQATMVDSYSKAPKTNKNLVQTILLIVISILLVIFIGLFVWMFVQWDSAKTNVDGQINEAVASAVDENTKQLQNEFAEQEKYPYKTFTGPAEYGSLSFEYPKTWSVYIAENSSSGGDYIAYFNPGEISPIGDDTINALRVTITADTFEDAVEDYSDGVADGLLSQSVITVNNESINYYKGTLPGEKLVGRAVVFKLRDKVATIQTDAEVFASEFDKLLSTVTFSQ